MTLKEIRKKSSWKDREEPCQWSGPGSDDIFLATHKFYSPNDSKEAKIILAYPEDGEWKVRTLAELPFVHRF